MRVLHVMASGARGGGAEHLRGLVQAQRARGNAHPEVAVSGDGPLAEELAAQGVVVHGLDMMRSRVDPARALRLRSLVRRVAPTLVHYHGTRAAFFGACARAVPGTMPPVVYTVHGLAYRQSLSRAAVGARVAAEAVACAGAAQLISVSRRDLDDLVSRRFVSRANATHIPNAVALDSLGRVSRAEARMRLGLSADALVVGTVARLVAQKAVGELVQAVRDVPGATLVVVGDGPLRGELAASARGLSVQFLGARDDVPEILPALDVFALSSRWEGEPVALLEALATGLACVATATEGAQEILAGTEAGMLVEVGDTEALAASLRLLLADPARRQTLGARGRALVAGRSYERNEASVWGVYCRLVH